MSDGLLTPSAARGILEAIYWKPEIRWHIAGITVLKPIIFASVRRNELSDKIGAGTIAKAMKDGAGKLGFNVDEGDNRQQRATLMLRDVGYVIEAHIEILSGSGNIAKHLDQFNRRARKGQLLYPALSWLSRVSADFALLEEGSATPAIDASLDGERDLGWMLHDIDFANKMQAYFFRAAHARRQQSTCLRLSELEFMHDSATACRVL